MASFTNSIILKDKVLTVSVALAILFLIAGGALVYFNIADLTSPLILHFDSILGIDFFGEVQLLWFVWLTGFFVVVINFFLGHALFYRERPFSYLVFGITPLFALLHLVAIARIISLN
jgi:hypothetical protein